MFSIDLFIKKCYNNIRDFLIQKPTNRIVFSQYVENDTDFKREKTISDVAKKLRITLDTAKNQVTAIPNSGKANEILSFLRG